MTEVDAVENLRREGRPSDRIYFVGNVMIDALQQFLPLAQNSHIVEDLGLSQNGKVMPFAVLTLHRPSNVDSPETLSKLLSAIEAVASQITVILPVHPRSQLKLDQLKKNSQSQLRAIAPLGYLEFLCLLSLAKLVLTDSGAKHGPGGALSDAARKYRAASNGHERNQPYSWSRSRKNKGSDEGYIGRS